MRGGGVVGRVSCFGLRFYRSSFDIETTAPFERELIESRSEPHQRAVVKKLRTPFRDRYRFCHSQ
jgi:hypothetical protein